MNLDQITPECFILSLFIRDDGERFLLGDGAYTFKDNQQHFVANSYANDVVEVQGNDGVFLAGQVRRASSQSFDGYIGDATVSKPDIEEYRKDFLAFFRKNYYYTVVYIFPNGDVIQRRKGFIVDAPEVKELFQVFPEYHIALNFEDVNYYSYSEDPDGNEKYTKSATIYLSTGASSGGLVWDNIGAVSNNYTWITPVEIEGSEIEITNSAGTSAPIESIQFKGDTEQQSYSGKNLFNFNNGTLTIYQNTSNTSATYDDNNITMTAIGTTGSQFVQVEFDLDQTKTYSISGVASKIVKGTGGQPYLRVTYVYSDNGSSWSSSMTGFSENNPTEGTEYPFSFQISGHRYYRVRFYNNANTPVTVGEKTSYNNVQIEQGSATTYEPYVGGIPAPNPDYPQPINVVTGGQVVTISDDGGESQSYEVNLGKNLLSFPTDTGTDNGIEWARSGNSITITGASTNTQAYRWLPNADTALPVIIPAGTYTISRGNVSGASGAQTLNFNFRDVDNSTIVSNIRLGIGGSSKTFTLTKDAYYFRVAIEGLTQNTPVNITYNDLQLEVGSTATTYAPYFTPIELCKIGDYQDYIYKSGDDWYVHKEIGKAVLDGTESWYLSGNPANYLFNTPLPLSLAGMGNPLVSDMFIWSGSSSTLQQNVIYINSSGRIVFINPISAGTTIASNVDDWETWLGSHNTHIYYALSTPTDTQITNSALISQLNALAGAELAVGENNIVVTAAGSNLPSILDLRYYTQIDYGGAGYEWEAGSGAGPTTVMVDSIDRVYPVWELTGPADNPQLSVLTTNTTIKYSGTVTASQTLVIDMFNKTAKLNGASVIGNVSGDWLYFDAGNNRVAYTTNNADANPSTIYWQEVVG